MHAYVRACVRDTTLFFFASRPNPKRCADSPLTQPSRATNQRVVATGRQQVQWADVCDEHTDKQTPRLCCCNETNFQNRLFPYGRFCNRTLLQQNAVS